MDVTPDKVVANPTPVTRNCTASSCEEEGASAAHPAVYLSVAAVFLMCTGLAVWWRRRMWNRRAGQSMGGASQAQPRMTLPDLDPAGQYRAMSNGLYADTEPEPGLDHQMVANADYENVMVIASDHGDHAQCMESDQEYMEYDPLCSLANEDSIYNNDVLTAIYHNRPMQDLVQDDMDNTYVFPDQLFQQEQP